MAKRIPNRLKLCMVFSDRSKIEGTIVCSDEKGADIIRVLFPRPGHDQGIAKAFASPIASQPSKADA
jgi:hypothetical protein